MDCTGVGVVVPRGPQVAIERRVGISVPYDLLILLVREGGHRGGKTDELFVLQVVPARVKSPRSVDDNPTRI